jgi:hypothetical protein
MMKRLELAALNIGTRCAFTLSRGLLAFLAIRLEYAT